MKALAIAIILSLLAVACKKREENSADPIPKATRVQVAEITDSYLDYNTSSSEQYFYDEQGRMVKTIRPDKDASFTLTSLYSYNSGKLSSIISTSPINDFFQSRTQISRNDQAQLKRIQSGFGEWGADRTMLYNESGHLYQTIDASIGGFYAPPDTAFYSQSNNGRFTFSHEKLAYNAEKKQWRTFDSEGRIKSTITFNKRRRVGDCNYTLVGERLQFLCTPDTFFLDSTKEEYDYFPMIELEKTMLEQRKEVVLNYYSPNLDVYDLYLSGAILPLQLYHAGYRKYVNGVLVRETTSIIENTNHLGLPTSIFTVDSGEKGVFEYESRPATKTRRTIRYEVE